MKTIMVFVVMHMLFVQSQWQNAGAQVIHTYTLNILTHQELHILFILTLSQVYCFRNNTQGILNSIVIILVVVTKNFRSMELHRFNV